MNCEACDNMRARQLTGDLTPGEICTDMADAVSRAYALAVPGDVVLLSPGCASFDMFENYKDRGDAFCRAVAAI